MMSRCNIGQLEWAVLQACATRAALIVSTIALSGLISAQVATKPASNAIDINSAPRFEKSATPHRAKKPQHVAKKPAAPKNAPRLSAAQLIDARREAAKQAVRSAKPIDAPAPYADTYTPAYAPLSAYAYAYTYANGNGNINAHTSTHTHANANARTRASSSQAVNIAPTSVDAHVLRNIYEPLSPPMIEVGDRPARGTSLCSDGRVRRFGEIDMKAFAQTLPDFNVARPRTVCVRRGVLMADYFFK